MGGSADEAEVIDLMEMTAILLIPYLVKAARIQRGEALPEGIQCPSSPHTIKHVCQMMLHDLQVNDDDDDDNDDETNNNNKNNSPVVSSDQAPPLSLALIQKILLAYGEDDLAADNVLCQEMLDLMAGHEVFDAAALAQALTADVQLYNLDNERRYASLYQDIFTFGNNSTNEANDENEKALGQDQDDNNNNNNNNNNNGAADNDDDDDEIPLLKHTFTAPAIDSTAGTYRSKSM